MLALAKNVPLRLLVDSSCPCRRHSIANSISIMHNGKVVVSILATAYVLPLLSVSPVIAIIGIDPAGSCGSSSDSRGSDDSSIIIREKVASMGDKVGSFGYTPNARRSKLILVTPLRYIRR